jgi:hypothetical protein
MLWLLVSTGRAKDFLCSQIRTRINGVRVPAIVFDYPRHSGATDEGMTHGSSILAYLVFGPRRVSIEGMARPTKMIAWHGPRVRLDVRGKDSKRSSRIRDWIGFIQTDSICTLLGEQSQDPTFAYKMLGGRSCSDDILFAIIHPGARILKSSPLSARSNLRPRCNTTIVATPSIKSDKQDLGHYPTRGSNLGKTCVSLCRLIAVEFAGSRKHSMIRKPSSMGIVGVEPRQMVNKIITELDMCLPVFNLSICLKKCLDLIRFLVSFTWLQTLSSSKKRFASFS